MGRNMVSARDLKEIHCKPFQSAITEAGMRGVMCSYCSMNGEPVVASKTLLTDILRDEMGFEGIVVSDYVAVDRLVECQIKGVLTDNPDGGHGNLDAAAAIVTVHHHQI